MRVVKNMRKCAKCLITEGKYNVVLNDKGICNYCEAFEEDREDILNLEKNNKYFLERIEKFKGKYEYDALVGISGGKDSSYILYQLVNKYKLKVLSFTYDLGFLTDFSKNTIETLVKKTGVDHFYYKPKWETHKKLYKAAIENFGDPCIACAFVVFFSILRISYERKIPFFIHGRTPYQMYKNYYKGTKDMFLSWMKLNLSEHSFEALAEAYRPANDMMRNFVTSISNTPEDAKEFLDEFFLESDQFSKEFTPEFLAYFLYERYDMEKMQQKLVDVFEWEEHPGESKLGHNDCILNAASSYLFKEFQGVDVLEREVATMIRFGDVDKEIAVKWIEASQPSQVCLNKSMNKVCELCNCSSHDLDETIKRLKEKKIQMFGSR